MVPCKGDFSHQGLRHVVLYSLQIDSLNPYDLENINYCDDHCVPNGKVIHLG